MYEIKIYETEAGNRPFEKYIEKLSKKHRIDEVTEIINYLDKLKEFGYSINEKFKPLSIKRLRDDIYELRPSSSRVFFFYFKDNTFIILHGYEKKQNKTEPKEIEKAYFGKERLYKEGATMKDLITLDQMYENIKSRSEASKLTIEAAEKTIKIINKIVEARKALGLTQRELAKKCGIQQPVLARIETCRVIPKLNTIIKIAQAVGVNIAAFTSGESKQLQVCYSISQIAINSTLYNNAMEGSYETKQYYIYSK